jgi:hypothetical protein
VIIRINEAKDSPERKKKKKTNEKFNNVSSDD